MYPSNFFAIYYTPANRRSRGLLGVATPLIQPMVWPLPLHLPYQPVSLERTNDGANGSLGQHEIKDQPGSRSPAGDRVRTGAQRALILGWHCETLRL
ncbi:hypothetical protein CAP31_08600 [Sulfuriferula sp. AH1]|uniref:hypothetical protein n=1 Tax=Sulfuriferula sp. AH1 TaxID=1985873 RepID=UPI000B3B545F|nr:hypothetical protein [Sulfuriferula sp. AH1]ARU31733.1 hypothetical protein CAP31_08600 [Sulfuriferula sp. AH1]